MNRFGKYLNDTAAEMKHVKWPTVKQTIIYSALVIAISAFTALFVAAFDYVFTNFLNSLI
jgi:preprotein translocase, SecE subunit, bacterial